MDLEKVEKCFEEYVNNYDKSIKEISLKYYHSYKVMELMGKLANSLNLTDEEVTLSKIIGLLHDIGRFEQFKKYNTFNDEKSVNHADESVKYLFDENHIRDFIDENKYDKIIYDAIKNHNKKVPYGNDVFMKMIRDMDKVDIYRACAVNYEYNFIASEVSESVLKDFKDEKIIDLSTRNTQSDAIIIICAFLFDINFDESFDILADTDNFELFISSVHADKDSEKLWNKIKEICINKINEGVI